MTKPKIVKWLGKLVCHGKRKSIINEVVMPIAQVINNPSKRLEKMSVYDSLALRKAEKMSVDDSPLGTNITEKMSVDDSPLGTNITEKMSVDDSLLYRKMEQLTINEKPLVNHQVNQNDQAKKMSVDDSSLRHSKNNNPLKKMSVVDSLIDYSNNQSKKMSVVDSSTKELSLRDKLIIDFENGINLDETIKKLALTEQELVMSYEDVGQVVEYSSTDEEIPLLDNPRRVREKKDKGFDYHEPQYPGRNLRPNNLDGSGLTFEEGQGSNYVPGDTPTVPYNYTPSYPRNRPVNPDRNYNRRKQSYRETTRFPPSRNIPSEYNPRDYNHTGMNILDIDCVNNKVKTIDEWASAIDVIIQSNVGLRESITSSKAFIAHKLTGNVKVWINNLTPEERYALEQGCTTGMDYLRNLTDTLYTVFTGRNKLQDNSGVLAKEQSEARWHLSNMQICNMCYFKPFSCEYEKYYYRLDESSKLLFKDMFYNKLPKLTGDKMKEEWSKRGTDIPDTLGGKIRVVEIYMLNKCMERQEYRSMKDTIRSNQICCDPAQIDLPGQYGCSNQRLARRKTRNRSYPSRRRRKRTSVRYHLAPPSGRVKPKYRRYNFRKRSFRKFKSYNPQPFKRRRFFKKRPPRGNSYNRKADNCPTGTANCRCWLCNEAGHYANRCPNKEKISKEKVKILEKAYQLKLYPIEEEDVSDNDSIYEINTDEELTDSDYESEEDFSESESEYDSEELESDDSYEEIQWKQY